jgi:tetratricopeptide (TPR) repeat protein
MTPERWKEIDRIFEKALELEPAARADYLRAACAGDADLRRQVESLLTHDTDESLVGQPSLEDATVLFSRSLREAVPRFIGRYRVERSLGIGGMGQVFLAHDEQLKRPVGVKLLLGYDAAAPERVKRFRREALAASALNHPNILAEVHNDLAGISMVYYRDPAATEREARRAVELNPKFQEIHYLYSNYLLIKGEVDSAIGEAQKAIELDPLSVRVSNNLGYCYYLARRYEEAIEQFRQALEPDEHNPMVHEGPYRVDLQRPGYAQRDFRLAGARLPTERPQNGLSQS